MSREGEGGEGWKGEKQREMEGRGTGEEGTRERGEKRGERRGGIGRDSKMVKREEGDGCTV